MLTINGKTITVNTKVSFSGSKHNKHDFGKIYASLKTAINRMASLKGTGDVI